MVAGAIFNFTHAAAEVAATAAEVASNAVVPHTNPRRGSSMDPGAYLGGVSSEGDADAPGGRRNKRPSFVMSMAPSFGKLGSPTYTYLGFGFGFGLLVELGLGLRHPATVASPPAPPPHLLTVPPPTRLTPHRPTRRVALYRPTAPPRHRPTAYPPHLLTLHTRRSL